MRHHRILLDRQECTSCDICVRECPTRCIALTSHKETITEEGARPRVVNVLDEFTIDWSLCMYCGICIEECPFDALAWDDSLLSSAGDRNGLVERL